MITNTFIGWGIAGMMLMLLLFVILPVLIFTFWIAMIIDCAQRKFKNKEDKVIWILVIILTHIIGAVIYYMIIKRKKR